MTLLDEAVAAGARLGAACEALGLSERTLQRWRKSPDVGDKRRGPRTLPAHALSDAEWARVRALATAPEFVDLSPHQLVAKLADMGIYVASERSFYRELHRAKLVTHRERSRPRTNRKPVERVAAGPNQTWAWDITYLPGPVVGTYYFLYAILDVWSRKLVAWAVYETQSDQLAAQLAERACQQERVSPGHLLLHADNGSAMKGKTMLAKLEELGVMPSFSRPRVSDDNPFAEAFFRTLKYRPTSPDRRFASLEEARRWVALFVAWYNEDHQHSAIRFVTPSERHDGREHAVLRQRHQLYLMARQRTPRRWSREIRNWTPIGTVTLNPARPRLHHRADTISEEAAA